MGRSRHIPKDAKPTTISLTIRQHIAFQELQIKRQREGRAKPTLTEVMVDGFQMLLKREGLSDSEVEQIFPIQERPKAKVHIIRKRRRT